MHKAVFLDRDGVINYDFGYIHEISNFKFIEGSLEACKILYDMGFLIIVVTNQSGIARGFYDLDDLNNLHKYMKTVFEKQTIKIKEILYCPHHPEGKVDVFKKDCDCRKPKPGLIMKAIQKYDIDVSRSFLVGDKISDMEAANNAKLPFAFKMGKKNNFANINWHTKVYQYKNLFDCVEAINRGEFPQIFKN